jgi:sigma-B regulation protein RsbU (phosphoserine phosphatase)
LSGLLAYCNAGHNPPYLLRADGSGRLIVLDATGMALGVIPEATWTTSAVRMRRGDVLVLYSDGITEAHNPRQQLFGEERLARVTRSSAGATSGDENVARGVQEAILAAVYQFAEGAPRSDDIAVVVIARTD